MLDSAGNRTRKTVGGESVAYAYDALNSLIEQFTGRSSRNQNQAPTYTYGRVSSRLSGPAKQVAYGPRQTCCSPTLRPHPPHYLSR